MRVFSALAVILLVQAVFAATPSDQGSTILKPAGGDAAAGSTVLTPSGAAPANAACVGTSCQAAAAAPAPAANTPAVPPPAGYKNAIVIHAQAPCGCQQQDVSCQCNQPQYVEPEIKPDNNTCGCLQQEVCGCRVATVAPETVAPEQAPSHVAPEVVSQLKKPCDPTVNPCAPQPEFVQPELKAECPCATQVNVECACSHFKPNF